MELLFGINLNTANQNLKCNLETLQNNNSFSVLEQNIQKTFSQMYFFGNNIHYEKVLKILFREILKAYEDELTFHILPINSQDQLLNNSY